MINRTGANLPASSAPRLPSGTRAIDRQLEHSMPSGRSLVLRTDPLGEEIEIHSGRGEVEVKIVLTDAGPVVTLGGGRLLVESRDVSFRCQRFSVHAESEVNIHTSGDIDLRARELRAETAQDIHLNGAYIRLNCTPDAAVQPPLPMPALASSPAHCCGGAHAADPADAAQPRTEPPT